MSLRIAMIGAGAIGRALTARLAVDPEAPQVTDVLLREGRSADGLAGAPRPHRTIDALCEAAPDLVVECAGQAAVAEHVETPLARGIDVVVVSIGAFAEDGLLDRLRGVAKTGGAHVHLCPGAIGGLDALGAAALAGLDRLEYTARKTPAAFRDTPAEARCDLDALTEPFEIFAGSAAEAARLYPKNANVAMTVALAGLGPDRTRVRIIADPNVATNGHEIDARGAFGTLHLDMANAPSPDNPKTSLLTVLGLERVIRNRAATIRM
ncbi:aspartate dehydrogenase [Tranquillimonas rosea]|uniref:L-aspartate dehydrogenase n=1 Tax=Tranquillimonas rosea TaxID=641238 RepID=A0A1H9WPB1_9RHOB|nr:aspartate dehydrogenase [Tranquillimonas rosea]SES35740.1 aspartate dehydrogenase [Tranquillimonas rosea]